MRSFVVLGRIFRSFDDKLFLYDNNPIVFIFLIKTMILTLLINIFQ